MDFIQRNRSVFIILIVSLLLVLWIASGMLFREPPQLPPRAEATPMTVAVVYSQAESIARQLILQGELVPDQRVSIRAETAGQIEALPVARGSFVAAGTVIARIAENDRPARIRQAEAAVKGREGDFQAAQRLSDSGFQGQLQVQLAEANLEAARAALETARLDLARTRIRAPIDGVLNLQPVSLGSYVGVGDTVAEIVENHPLRAVVQVPQHQIQHLQHGARAWVRPASGDQDAQPHEGSIRYLSAVADTATRTFRVEIALPNPERKLPSGVSAQVEIPLQQVLAHRISPALVVLGEKGELGIKAVDEQDLVVFLPLQPVRADVHGLWVAGLPERIRLISIGHGFVNPGERVLVVNQAQGQ